MNAVIAKIYNIDITFCIDSYIGRTFKFFGSTALRTKLDEEIPLVRKNLIQLIHFNCSGYTK